MNSRRKWLPKLIERIGYRFADAIITSSKRNFEYVEKNYNPSGIHALIPNYVKTDVFKPLNTNKKKDSICFIGRLSTEKNLYALLKALNGLSYALTIIGSGEQKELLNNFTIENAVNVNFLGNIPNHDLPEILNKHELFILPSLYENMPKTLLEAMSCGMPVIGTNVKGINEVIEHGKNGILCDTDSNSIRNAIISLMGDEALKEKLGENARRTIVENYSLDVLAKKELELMGALV
jgi:glycosyltransferase involved in cell wall biosynthesis